MSAMFKSFAIANYRLWFAVATVSNVGTWMQRTAQDWIVLTELTDNDAAAVGVTMALQFGPALVLTPLTGLVSDLFDRRKVLMITQAVMGVLALGLGVLTVTGAVELWMVYGFALGLGIASAFDGPVRQTFVSTLVPTDYLSNAVGLNATSFNTARLIGPAVAGVLTALIGAGWVFLLNAVTFAATIGGLMALHRDRLNPQVIPARSRGQMSEGLRYVRGRPDLMLVFGMVALFGTFGMNFAIYNSTMSVLFGSGAGEFGVLSSVMAIGSVIGALLAARRDRPRLRTITIAAASFGLAVGAAAISPNLWVYGVFIAVSGLFAITTMNSANAYVQTTTTPTVRGRVMSLYMAIFMGGSVVGAPLIGWIANAVGPRWAMAAGGAAGLVAAAVAGVYFVRTRHIRLRWEPSRRWPLRLGTGPRARELATTEIAVIETESSR
ncbi:MAG TPA: MFS transporter [Pseudolysinimonas sp.]|nr:MFS transporter [Pseudolysinimonas sp.]